MSWRYSVINARKLSKIRVIAENLHGDRTSILGTIAECMSFHTQKTESTVFRNKSVEPVSLATRHTFASAGPPYSHSPGLLLCIGFFRRGGVQRSRLHHGKRPACFKPNYEPSQPHRPHCENRVANHSQPA